MSITGNRSLFSQFNEHQNAPTVKFGCGTVQQALGWGTVCLTSSVLQQPVTLTKVLCIPGYPVNLISVQSVAYSSTCTVSFSSTACTAVRVFHCLVVIPSYKSGCLYFHIHFVQRCT